MKLTMSPGPFELNINQHDVEGLRLVGWITDTLGTQRMGDVLDILDCARWWTLFFASQSSLHRSTEKQASNNLQEAAP